MILQESNILSEKGFFQNFKDNYNMISSAKKLDTKFKGTSLESEIKQASSEYFKQAYSTKIISLGKKYLKQKGTDEYYYLKSNIKSLCTMSNNDIKHLESHPSVVKLNNLNLSSIKNFNKEINKLNKLYTKE